MYRVLLADDEQIERMALAKRLKRHFCGSLDISEAVNGAEALETFKREKSQIVVMDISMPEMNGTNIEIDKQGNACTKPLTLFVLEKPMKVIGINMIA